jgi:hypothetical protein
MKTPLLLITALLVLSGCDDYNDLYKLDRVDYNNYQYRGSISIPLGNTNISLSTEGINLPEGWQQSPQLLNFIDTIWFEKYVYFDFSTTMGDTDKIEAVWLRIIANNDFPAEMRFQIYFADTFKVIHDSLSKEELKFAPARLSYYGKHIRNGVFYHEEKLERETIRKFGYIKYLILKEYIIIDNSQIEYFIYYKDLQINIFLAFRVDFNFNLKNL